MTDSRIDSAELKKRTRRSFSAFILLFLLGIGLWTWARHQPDVDETPAPFRTVLEWNGKLWRSLFNSDALNRADAPPPGKRPRVNGKIGLSPDFDPNQWSMDIVADGDHPETRQFSLSMAEIRMLPKVETTSEFRCIEGWSDVISYGGVRFSDFIKYYHLGAHSGRDVDLKHPPADLFRYVGLVTPDSEYYVSIDIESMLHPQTLLAYEMNGKPLSIEDGAPLRLIIPVKYGVKSLKRIGEISFSDTRPPDYWAERGYDWFAGL